MLNPKTIIALSTFVWLAPMFALAGADTLVVKGKDGKFVAGAAKSWSVQKSPDGNGDTVTFELAEGQDPNQVATVLTDRLFNVKVSVEGNKVTVAGLPNAMLLEQLSTLSLSGEGDPLADLAGLGETVLAMAPEAGGSIRASKPTALPAAFAEHDTKERFVGEIVKVTQGQFPQVRLKVRVKARAKSGDLTKKLKRGKVIEASVLLTARAGAVDFGDQNNQRNLGAYYLSKGDRITAHAIESKDGEIVLDYVERQKR